MDTISNSVWQRRGSSVIFDQKSLGRFIADGATVSLRQVLSWTEKLPEVLPVPGRTILVVGLETIMETMPPLEVESFLGRRIRPILINLQDNWAECGVVFGFSAHHKTFVETAFNEELVFRRRDNTIVHLSEGLWGGSVTAGMKRVVRAGAKDGEETIVGYYVARIS